MWRGSARDEKLLLRLPREGDEDERCSEGRWLLDEGERGERDREVAVPVREWEREPLRALVRPSPPPPPCEDESESAEGRRASRRDETVVVGGRGAPKE